MADQLQMMVPAADVDGQFSPDQGPMQLISSRELAIMMKPSLQRLIACQTGAAAAAGQQWVVLTGKDEEGKLYPTLDDISTNYDLVYCALANCKDRAPALPWLSAAFMWVSTMMPGAICACSRFHVRTV